MAAALAADGAQAAAGWSAPQTVARRAALFQFAVGTRGDAALAWAGTASGDGAVRVATARPRAPFGAPRVMRAPLAATGSDEQPVVAVDARGGVLVAWRADSSVVGHRTPGHLVAAWRRSGARRFQRAQVLSPSLPGAVAAEVAMNARSDAVLAWRGVRGRIEVAFVSAGHFSPPRALDGFTDYSPSVAINDAGDAAIAWIEQRASGAKLLRVVVRPGGRMLGPIEEVAQDRRVSGPELAIARDGRIAIVWLGTWGAQRLRAAERDPQNATWTPPSTVPQNQFLYYQPADEYPVGVGFGRDNELMVGWTETHVTADSAIEQSVFRVATQPLDGAWTAPVTLARGAGQQPDIATLSFGPDGTAAAGWYQPRTAHGRGALVASFAPPGRPFGTPTRIAPHPGCNHTSCSTLLELRLGLDASGGARAAWNYYYLGGGERIGAAHRQLAH